MLFGMVNVLVIFVRLVSKVFIGLEDFMEVFIDDIGIYSNIWEEYFEYLGIVFEVLRKVNLVVWLVKCEFGFNEFCFFGYIIGSGKIKLMMLKVEVI